MNGSRTISHIKLTKKKIIVKNAYKKLSGFHRRSFHVF